MNHSHKLDILITVVKQNGASIYNLPMNDKVVFHPKCNEASRSKKYILTVHEISRMTYNIENSDPSGPSGLLKLKQQQLELCITSNKKYI